MLFQCSNCSTGLIFNSSEFNNSTSNQNGYLSCNHCFTNTPIVNGVAYFTATDIAFEQDEHDATSSIKNRVEGKRDEYSSFIKNKLSRNLIDPYAAFQPFNESSRSFYPFIKALRSLLKPGDYILDTWCRTGWTAFFLSSLFPEQQIVSIWEGDKDVLGYSGFDYWFGTDMPENVQIVFHDINMPLPFPEGTFKAVHALDTIHRYNQATLLPELLRVTKKNGVLICPHNHLTNSEPSPFFDRGEKQIHGRDYDRYFKKVLKEQNRSSYILSEPGLFDLKSSRQIDNDPEIKDYNALIAILPADQSIVLEPYNFISEDFNKLRIIVNPYFKFEYATNKAILDPSYLDGTVGEMLTRHPIYDKRCSLENILSEVENKIIYLSMHGYSCPEIAKILKIQKDDLIATLSSMSERELIQVLPISKRALNLQFYHSAQPFKFSENSQSLHSLLHLNDDNGYPIIIDEANDSQLYVEDVQYLVSKLKNALIQAGLNKDSKIVISSFPQFEVLITFWAAMELGVQTLIISTELPEKQKAHLLNKMDSNYFLFVDSEIHKEVGNNTTASAVIIFDDEKIESHPLSFSFWLEKYPDREENQAIEADDESIAATLFSSGTTGNPKGIKLSHRSLYLSGQLMSKVFGWTAQDKIIMTSEIDAMSGLRNICVATRFSGTPIIVPTLDSNKALSLIQSIEKYEATILTCTPALIKQLITLGRRIQPSIKSLRQVLCTAGNLSESIVKEFQTLFNIRILNYYGLTESCGLCIAETASNELYDGSIGQSIDSIVQIVDESDQILPIGEVGSLRVFNDRLFSGYLDQEDSSNLQVKNGWLYTGDLAYLGEGGKFYLKGRERDIIKDVNGNVIYLEEIENLITTHPQINDLVLLKDYTEHIESLLLVVAPNHPVSNQNELRDQLIALVRENLGESKIPTRIEFVSELLRDGRGNVVKDQLSNLLPNYAR